MAWQYEGILARPQEFYLRETVALTAALILGRRHIFADYLTGRRNLLIVVLLFVQLAIIAAGTALVWWLLTRMNASPDARQLVTAWSLGSSLVVWGAIAAAVLRRFSFARSTARIVPLIRRRGTVGEYTYNPPRQDDFRKHLEGHLRLGVSRTWGDSVFGRGAPPLDLHGEHPDLRMVRTRDWMWLTQNIFEPELLLRAAAACFLTLNFNWIYFLVASISLGKSGHQTECWFNVWGHEAFWNPELERRKAEEERAAADVRAAEELRKRFPTAIVATPTRSMSAADARAQLPDTLRRLMDAEE